MCVTPQPQRSTNGSGDLRKGSNRNYRFFIIFVFFTTLLCIFVFAFCLLYVRKITGSEHTSIPKALMIVTPASIVIIIYIFIALWFFGGKRKDNEIATVNGESSPETRITVYDVVSGTSPEKTIWMESSVVSLSLDIICEILSRVPQKTLERCRLLSKEIRIRTYESKFLNLHSQRNKLRGFFMQWKDPVSESTFVSANDEDGHLPSIDFIKPKFGNSIWIVASSNRDILLCTDGVYYYVCKPSTKQYMELPRADPGIYESFCIQVLKSTPLHFKVIILPHFCRVRHYLVFDSDIWCWEVRHMIDGQDRINGRKFYKPSVFAGGAFHWLTTENNIRGFDLEQETWRLVTLPRPEIDINKDKVQLIDYEGELGLIVRMYEHECDLWVFSQNLWTMRHSVILEPMLNTKPYSFRYSSLMVAFCNGNIALPKKLDFRCLHMFHFESDGQQITLNGNTEEKEDFFNH